MIISFEVENVFSFRDRAILDFRASSDIKDSDGDAIFRIGRGKSDRLLRTVGVYGANASGKSNLCRAFIAFLKYIAHSTDRLWMEDHSLIVPFLLDADGASMKRPSRIEIKFLVDGKRYRYGFELFGRSFIKEWLFLYDGAKKKYVPVFMRKNEAKDNHVMVKIMTEDKILKGTNRKIASTIRVDSLFLSVCSNFNISLASKIVDSLCRNTHISSTLNTSFKLTARMLIEHDALESKIIDFVRQTDPCIGDIIVKEVSDDNGETMGSNSKKRLQVRVKPTVPVKCGIFDGDGVLFQSLASAGTIKSFELAGPIFKALSVGGLVAIDEFGSAMHPLLSQMIIRLFNSSKTNPHNAQLIFITHDSNLLATKNGKVTEDGRKDLLLRSDQIYFIERDALLSSHLYSHSEFEGKEGLSGCMTREDAYLEGQFGAIPFFSDKKLGKGL